MINSKSKNRNLSQEDVFNFSELFKLMKPRVMSLVIFTCAVGLLMAPNTITSKDAMIAILLVFFANLIYSFSKKKAAAKNPWGEGATTLEWTVPSPPNFHTFEELPKFEDPDGVEKATS